ncbi:NADH-dependent flavin oxidoreductase iccG [Fulvia fulva]|uniref:NADH-dependent flavin oxidoreductase iccG n=1 Tax=Passalora fulva TaxID=5499 RepID=A0A9Q8LJ89_PASFU|nr:NADH-dependent flavin oxidoreductase iccG [Fulvia fulva]KAK4621764.1 NADH-dependent flavin oxidoreductase iccG [Fulvia fulva]KAK4622554.1 NADH-dependent flavin oxidoreductase iccG [Fulvia fulva]UJO18408.1 NADH-dependent flavin oxidoreductase iccG [Fulvia fulva]WPV16019.1 NADH-dependent flavin oxidoreductase iccG [Fulvia fulva]WPV31669.1 NADH-dependent flavin oxidoreductase iccG [Fulvia fulva]
MGDLNTTNTPPKTAIDLLSQPLTLPCGLTLPNRLVKCPMQETLAEPPNFEPPISKFQNLYKIWSESQYGLLITGQVQVDIRYFSIAGDVCTHPGSTFGQVLDTWKEWASIAQKNGTPCIVQLAHPGRMSPAGAGNREAGEPPLCPSSVPVKLGDGWLDKLALDKVLGTPKEMSHEDIDQAVENFVRGAVVARDAGFAGCQIHGAHGFLVSQFLSPHTNRRTDEYGGSYEKRMTLLKRLVREIRARCPPPYCLGVKLNSADYMSGSEGLQQEEALEQMKWLINCGMVDFVELSGGNAEQKTSGLQSSFGKKTMSSAPRKRESTRIREAFFTDFAEKVQALNSPIPIQLSGGFRSRTGMADAIESGVCDMVGLGRAAVLEPELPRKTLLNPEVDDDTAIGISHQIQGLWFTKFVPTKVIGGRLPIQFFYYNMRRLGNGMMSDPNATLPFIFFHNLWRGLKASVLASLQRLMMVRAASSGQP